MKKTSVQYILKYLPYMLSESRQACLDILSAALCDGCFEMNGFMHRIDSSGALKSSMIINPVYGDDFRDYIREHDETSTDKAISFLVQDNDLPDGVFGFFLERNYFIWIDRARPAVLELVSVDLED